MRWRQMGGVTIGRWATRIRALVILAYTNIELFEIGASFVVIEGLLSEMGHSAAIFKTTMSIVSLSIHSWWVLCFFRHHSQILSHIWGWVLRTALFEHQLLHSSIMNLLTLSNLRLVSKVRLLFFSSYPLHWLFLSIWALHTITPSALSTFNQTLHLSGSGVRRVHISRACLARWTSGLHTVFASRTVIIVLAGRALTHLCKTDLNTLSPSGSYSFVEVATLRSHDRNSIASSSHGHAQCPSPYTSIPWFQLPTMNSTGMSLLPVVVWICSQTQLLLKWGQIQN